VTILYRKCLLSSVGQSASLVMRMSAVRIRQEAQKIFFAF
jgi:hypothetical protein